MQFFQKPAVRFGFLGALVSIVVWLAMYLSGNIERVFNGWFAIGLLVISLSILILSNLEERKVFKGHYNFVEALKSGLIFLAIGWVMQVAFNQVMARFVDPELPQIQKEILISTTEERLAAWNVPQTEIDKTIEEMDKTDPWEALSLTSTVKGLAMYSVMAVIIASLVAIFTRSKKKDPLLEEFNES
jgi:hypothetical protein